MLDGSPHSLGIRNKSCPVLRETRTSDRGETVMTAAEITSLLFIQDNPSRSDLALVFGHRDPDVSSCRARRAADLYHAGFVPKLLLTGGTTSDGDISEASHMARVSMELGVPANDILLEAHAGNTVENVTNSVELLRESCSLEALSAVMLISCPWHMARVRLLARRSFPSAVRLLCCPHQESWTAGSWATSREGRACVLSELRLFSRLEKSASDNGGEPR
jgi:vancomycin permeability regulator SanA